MIHTTTASDLSAADRLWQGIQTLGLTFGMERSVRICRNAVLADRYLFTFVLPPLREARPEQLEKLFAELNPPAHTPFPLERLLQRADYIHFGYESTGTSDIFKIYFEKLPASLTDAPTASFESAIRFWALKWNASHPSQYVISRYRPRRFNTYDALHGVISEICEGSNRLVSQRFASAALDSLDPSVPISDLTLLEIRELQNPRRSFDLNVADAAIRIADLEDELSELFAGYEIPAEHMANFLATIGPFSLGHIAGGTHRGGEDFVTLYYGAEAFHE